MTPTDLILSEFRDHLQPSGFEKVAKRMILKVLSVVNLPRIKVAIPDGSGMPAKCNGFAKKASALATANARKRTPRKEQPKENGPRKALRLHILLDIGIRNILTALVENQRQKALDPSDQFY